MPGGFTGVHWDTSLDGITPDQLGVGVYESDILRPSPFTHLVVSWNCETPPGASVEVLARVWRGEEEASGSGWLSWGQWGTDIRRGSLPIQETDFAVLDTDTLTVTHGTADRLQLRVLLRGASSKGAPVLHLLAAAMKNAAIPRAGEIPPLPAKETDIFTPAYSQLQRDPKFARVICSATTLTMLLNRQGEALLPEEAALRNYDFTYRGHGNWPFTTALAGSLGYESYVRYGSLADLLEEISQGYPVGASVRYSNRADHSDYPFVADAPGDTGGHLLVVRGISFRSGEAYLLVNDPYGSTNEEVLRAYRLDQFLHAWSGGVLYIVHGKRHGSPFCRCEGELRSSGNAGEYTLWVDGAARPVAPNFTSLMAGVDCTGSIACIPNDARYGADPAGRPVFFMEPTPQGTLRFDGAALEKSYGTRQFEVVIAGIDGTVIHARIAL